MFLPSKIRQVYEQATCLYTTNEVEAALDRMAINIHNTISEKNPILLCVMVGGLVPLGNLLPRLDFPLEVDYIHATRYQGELQGGSINWKVRPTINIKDRTILVVDDILDAGITLGVITETLMSQGAKEVFSAVLVDKVNNRQPNGLAHADFVGLTVENHYIFGYGMDYHEYLRNAPGIFKVAPEHDVSV